LSFENKPILFNEFETLTSTLKGLRKDLVHIHKNPDLLWGMNHNELCLSFKKDETKQLEMQLTSS